MPNFARANALFVSVHWVGTPSRRRLTASQSRRHKRCLPLAAVGIRCLLAKHRRGTYGGRARTYFGDLDTHIGNRRGKSDGMWPALQPWHLNPPESGERSGPVDTLFDALLPGIGPGTARGARIGCSKQARTNQLSPIPGDKPKERRRPGWSWRRDCRFTWTGHITAATACFEPKRPVHNDAMCADRL